MTARYSVFQSRWFIGSTLIGTVAMTLVYVFGSVPLQISVVGSFVSMLAGIILSSVRELEHLGTDVTQGLEQFGASRALVRKPQLHDSFQKIMRSLDHVSQTTDPLFEQLASEKISQLTRNFDELNHSQLRYIGTEAWRNSYAAILNQSDVTEYHSVAWVRSLNYWQDQPVQESLKLNYDLAARGVRVTRTIILQLESTCNSNGELREPLAAWMHDQQAGGIHVRYVAEESLQREEDLLVDFGIYGKRAVGVLDATANSETLHFQLLFRPDDVRRYEARWERLQLYARDWQPGVKITL